MNETTDHIGIISAIRSGTAYVSLVQASACSGCASKSACGVGDSERRYFEIPVHGSDWHVGDEVIVRLAVQTGFAALWWGYGMPFVLLFVTLLAGIGSGIHEATAGLLAIGILLPYYLCLALFRRRLTRKMRLNILRR